MHDEVRADRPLELNRRFPAEILRREQIDPRERTAVVKMRIEVQEHHDRWALLGDVRAQERRGYVKALTPQPVWNYTMGVWEMRVSRIKQPPPAWVQIAKPTVLICLPLAAVLGAIWWFLLSLTTASLIGLCAVALTALSGLVAVHLKHTSVTIEQHQKVTIRR